MHTLIASSAFRRDNSAVFSPLAIAGCKLWLQALNLALNDSDPVTTWNDSSGNGNNATQATAGKKPLYKVNIINGKPVVRFDNTDDFLNVAAIDFTATSAITLFTVLANIGAGTDRVIYEVSSDYSAQTDAFLHYRRSDNKVETVTKGNVLTSTFISTETLTTGPTVISAVIDKTLATNEVTQYVNGASNGTRPANANNTNAFGNRASFIGMRAGTTLPLGGDIAEIILYNSALSAANRQLVERYLGGRYGITVA